MRIAVRFADEFNLTISSPQRTTERFAMLDAAAQAAGRDPATLRHSVMVSTLVGRDAAEVERRSRAVLDAHGIEGDGTAWWEKQRPRWIYGTPDEARAIVARYEAAGCERLMIQILLPWDLDHVDLLGEVLVRGYSASTEASR